MSGEEVSGYNRQKCYKTIRFFLTVNGVCKKTTFILIVYHMMIFNRIFFIFRFKHTIFRGFLINFQIKTITNLQLKFNFQTKMRRRNKNAKIHRGLGVLYSIKIIFKSQFGFFSVDLQFCSVGFGNCKFYRLPNWFFVL